MNIGNPLFWIPLKIVSSSETVHSCFILSLAWQINLENFHKGWKEKPVNNGINRNIVKNCWFLEFLLVTGFTVTNLPYSDLLETLYNSNNSFLKLGRFAEQFKIHLGIAADSPKHYIQTIDCKELPFLEEAFALWSRICILYLCVFAHYVSNENNRMVQMVESFGATNKCSFNE